MEHEIILTEEEIISLLDGLYNVLTRNGSEIKRLGREEKFNEVEKVLEERKKLTKLHDKLNKEVK